MSLKDDLSKEVKNGSRRVFTLGIIVGALFAVASFHDCIGYFNDQYETPEKAYGAELKLELNNCSPQNDYQLQPK